VAIRVCFLYLRIVDAFLWLMVHHYTVDGRRSSIRKRVQDVGAAGCRLEIVMQGSPIEFLFCVSLLDCSLLLDPYGVLY
jgi:hypothetical protein